ncbi:MAG: molecular chaperone HtpG [Ruminococcaceae bacterium]|nr:molecular chaperone HtpG [Oscillospiraceae bacterium]
MAIKQFKTESKKMLDMMINSVYTNKEIFLRELISNASDAIDKRYFRSLTDSSLGLAREEYGITIAVDKDNRTITVSDNGCGMTAEDLENNLGTIAHSDSGEFKGENKDENISIIGQFGVGFYSAFMVSSKIVVTTKALLGDTAYKWESEGVEGYTITECDKDTVGTEIVMYLKEDAENETYSEFMDAFRIQSLIRKYSDYIRYPIRMNVETSVPKEKAEGDNSQPEYETIVENRTLNSMVPLWHRKASDVTDEEYAEFYKGRFYDTAPPVRTIHAKMEGNVEYEMLLFIPQNAPYDYYSKDYEKGLQLYSDGVMIMEKCADLLPDYFNFIRGVVDSSDLTLNISRETLQQNYQVKTIAKSIEKKIKNELLKLQKENREKYEDFWKSFGAQIKFGVYNNYGINKEALQDLLVFRCTSGERFITLKEYVEAMPESQKAVYYAFAESAELAMKLPRTQAVLEKGFDVFLLTDDIDEFALGAINMYSDKPFKNVTAGDLDISTEDEKDALKKANEEYNEMFVAMQETLEGKVKAVRFSGSLGDNPISLSSEGYISAEMAKILSRMPGNEMFAHADMALEINLNHKLSDTLKTLFAENKEKFDLYTKILYAQARQISGLETENPVDLTNMICQLMTD